MRETGQRRIVELYSRVLNSGRPVYKSHWHEARPDILSTRDWRSCTAVDESAPTPPLTTVDMLLADILGPRHVPRDAQVIGSGSTMRWRIQRGLVTIEVHEPHEGYFGRVVYTSVTDPEFYSRVRSVQLSSGVADGWAYAPGWERCQPEP